MSVQGERCSFLADSLIPQFPLYSLRLQYSTVRRINPSQVSKPVGRATAFAAGDFT